MKITKSKLKKIIAEEISQIAEGPAPVKPILDPRGRGEPLGWLDAQEDAQDGGGEIIMPDKAGQSGAEKKPAGKEEKVYPDVQRALKQIEDKVMGFLKRVDMRMEKQQFVKLFLDYLNMIPADLIRIAKGDIEKSKTRGQETPIGTSRTTLATESKNIRVKYRKK